MKQEKQYTASDIADKLKMRVSQIRPILDRLVEDKVVERTKVGNTHVYKEGVITKVRKYIHNSDKLEG